MATDQIEALRERKQALEQALNPMSTEALRRQIADMDLRDLIHLRKLYRDRKAHVTRVTAERIDVIDQAIGKKHE
jgi:hypothetical protein